MLQQSNTIDIEPCPFCGETNTYVGWVSNGIGVECITCHATCGALALPSYSSKTNYMLRLKFKAVQKWNKRNT